MIAIFWQWERMPIVGEEKGKDEVRRRFFYGVDSTVNKGRFDVISIGILDANDKKGCKLHLFNKEADFSNVSDAVKATLPDRHGPKWRLWREKKSMAVMILDFLCIPDMTPIELWNYDSAHSHVVLFSLLDIAVNHPGKALLPDMTLYVKQYAVHAEVDVPENASDRVTAMEEAEWARWSLGHINEQIFRKLFRTRACQSM
jgi:hypothetical protein